MTKVEFCEKHNESLPAEMLKTTDVLMRIMSNLSDLQIEKEWCAPDELDDKINLIKRYASDYMTILRIEEQHKRYEEQEMREFNSHLGRM